VSVPAKKTATPGSAGGSSSKKRTGRLNLKKKPPKKYEEQAWATATTADHSDLDWTKKGEFPKPQATPPSSTGYV
jgi:hypothetical protein